MNNAEDAWEADWWHTQATYHHEKQGFMAGFAYAARLFGKQEGVVA